MPSLFLREQTFRQPESESLFKSELKQIASRVKLPYSSIWHHYKFQIPYSLVLFGNSPQKNGYFHSKNHQDSTSKLDDTYVTHIPNRTFLISFPRPVKFRFRN